MKIYMYKTIVLIITVLIASCSNQLKDEQNETTNLDSIENKFFIQFEKNDSKILEKFKIYISAKDDILINRISSLKWE